jgi:hypothetical protein
MGALIAAPAIVRIESLMPLWVPPAWPPPGVWVSGMSMAEFAKITREGVRLFVNTNAFLQNLDAEYEREFGRPGAMVGDALRIRLPSDYSVRI